MMVYILIHTSLELIQIATTSSELMSNSTTVNNTHPTDWDISIGGKQLTKTSGRNVLLVSIIYSCVVAHYLIRYCYPSCQWCL